LVFSWVVVKEKPPVLSDRRRRIEVVRFYDLVDGVREYYRAIGPVGCLVAIVVGVALGIIGTHVFP
jgi:hypothetical protein